MKIFFGAVIFFLSLFVGQRIMGQVIPGVTFPIPELGNCADRQACHSYCEEPVNKEACLLFAQTHRLMSDEEVMRAKKFLMISENGGPGNCRGESDCRRYCRDVAHRQECQQFLTEHQLVKENTSPEAIEVEQCTQGEECGETQDVRKEFGYAQREPGERTPPEVAECVANNVGEEYLTPEEKEEMKDELAQDREELLRDCWDQFNDEREFEDGEKPEQGTPFIDPRATSSPAWSDTARTFPEFSDPLPENPVSGCVQKLFGNDIRTSFDRGKYVETPEFKKKIAECMHNSAQGTTTFERKARFENPNPQRMPGPKLMRQPLLPQSSSSPQLHTLPFKGLIISLIQFFARF